MRTQLPRAICVSYSDHDLEHDRVPSDPEIIETFHRIVRKDFTTIPKRLRMGQPGECYKTVDQAVELFGGEAVFGWLFRRDMIVTGRNVLAPFHCCGQAVWRSPKGELTELIAGYEDMKFIADASVKNNCQVGLSFLDAAADAEKIEWIHDNIGHRCIRIW